MPFFRRFWIYQRERFPLAAHGLSVAAFTAAAVGLGHAFLGAPAASGWAAYAVAGIVLFCQFFLLRVADEFKDAQTDARFRPERPVPRGLIGLHDLRRLAAAAAVLQFLSILAFDIMLLPLLGLIWSWFGLMTVEFFAGDRLRKRPLPYMISHMMIMPLMAGFAMAAAVPEWRGPLPAVFFVPGAWIFCALSFAAGGLLEVGRKIKAPEEERIGVETYTALWGRRRALTVLVFFAFATGLSALWTAAQLGAGPVMGLAAGSGVCVLAVLAVLHDRRPRRQLSSAIERFSGAWVLFVLIVLALAGA